MLKTGMFSMLMVAMVFATVAYSQDKKQKQEAVNVGDKAPAFSVAGADGKDYTLEDIGDGAELVVMVFTCNNCPVAKAYERRLVNFDNKYSDKKVKMIAVNSNNGTEDLDAVKKKSKEDKLNYVYAFDASGKVAKDYGASVTPEVFIIQNGKVAYHGAFDDSQREPTKNYVTDAVDALLAGQKPETVSTKAFGCGIKMK